MILTMPAIKSSVKKVDDCKVKLFVEVESGRVESRFGEVFGDFRRLAHLPGFRQGKAPVDMVEKQFSREAHEEVLKSLIPEAYHEAVVAQKISPVALPKISDIQMERGKKLTFCAEVEKSPEVNVKNYKNIKLKREVSSVTDEDVEKALGSLLDSKATLLPLVESRSVQKGDFIVTDVEIWRDGKYMPGKKDLLLQVEPNEHDDFYDKVIGANIDDVKEIFSDPSDEEKKSGIVGRKPHYRISIRGIKEKKLPILDEEFSKGFGKDSVDDLKEAIRKDIASYKHSESINKMKIELFDKLLEQVNFALPQGLVEKQKERLLENARRDFARMGLTGAPLEAQVKKVEEEVDKKAKDQVKLYFIFQKIAELEDIHEDEIELEKRIQALAQESKQPVEDVRRTFEDDIRESMRETKTIDFLIANAKFEEKE